jgi:UrcA family protein
MIKSSPVLLAIALAGLAAAAQPAAAEPGRAIVIVSAADFASTHARARLDLRIRNAIESVCGSYSAAEVRDWSEIDRCWKSARAQAARTIAAAHGQTRLAFAGR